MSEYRCTWWEYTGRYSEFVDSVSSPIMRKMVTGEELSGADLPNGALWVAGGDPDLYPKGPDGLAICCRIPGKHTWFIDGRASNCTMKEDTEHRCWVRHGTVGELIHVDKNGNTCQAGGGSIATPGFHGFLHHGVLRDC
ncbi:hypothetical protein [Mesorhizobium sp.]|uniref:hypothetical protein n=1 Tax=Mesorhizobium sp. TaxID=1871066 RepID=UPI000FE4F514|nr:hypothetical protein [Mesorhizobium sp.]RWP64932.1 MAG: hypothetical protein EOR08_08440 [Mesorhizobium sp.]